MDALTAAVTIFCASAVVYVAYLLLSPVVIMVTDVIARLP